MSRRASPPVEAVASRPGTPAGGAQRRRSSRAAQPDAGAGLTIADNWPAAVPVTVREIMVIETYLGALLDELLREAAADG